MIVRLYRVIIGSIRTNVTSYSWFCNVKSNAVYFVNCNIELKIKTVVSCSNGVNFNIFLRKVMEKHLKLTATFDNEQRD